VARNDGRLHRHRAPVAAQGLEGGLAFERRHLAGGDRTENLRTGAADADRLGEDTDRVERLVVARFEQLDQRRVPVGRANQRETARERVGIVRDRVDLTALGQELVEVFLQRRGVALEQGHRRGLEEHAISPLALAERFLGVLARGRVDAGGDDLAQVARFVEDRPVAPRDPDALAVAPHVLVLVREVAAGVSQDVVHHLRQVAPGRLGLRHDGPDDRASQELAQRVAEEVLAVLVEVEDPALGVPAQHDAVDVRHQIALLPHRVREAAHRLAQHGHLGTQAIGFGAELRRGRLRGHDAATL
jgi:hypothetical protein